MDVPVLPNSPLNSLSDTQPTGKLCLRKNDALDFVENAAFDPTLAAYDQNYQNGQVHSKAFSEHMGSVLQTLKAHFAQNSRIVEVGCGKGDFVELLHQDGYFKASGYDATYEGSNPSITKRYLTNSDRIEADLIVLRHVLEHIQKPHDFLAMLRTVFGNKPIYIEVPNYDWIIENQAFFDITYEHVNYFSQRALHSLFDKNIIAAGLSFGDQYQYVVANLSYTSRSFAERYQQGEWRELDFLGLFPELSQSISKIERLLTQNQFLYIWGAATKGCMFLCHCRNDGKLIDQVKFAIDENPGKIGKFLPVSQVPIKHKQSLFENAKDDDLLVISNPIYKAEIMDSLRAGGLNIRVVCL